MGNDANTLSLLGVSISFKAGTDLSRVRDAIALIEERYAEQKQRYRGLQSKETLLTFLSLGMADELLQLQKQQDDLRSRIESLLSKIKEVI